MIELQSVIEELRSEIIGAVAAGGTEDIAFQLNEIEIELAVVVERQGGGSAKVKFWVAELGADGKLSQSQTQRVKLKLLPRDKRTGAEPWVRGQASPNER